MKWMLTFALAYGGITAASAQDMTRPLPSVVKSALPPSASAPAPTMISQPTQWSGGYPTPPSPESMAGGECGAGGCATPRGGFCERMKNWLTFRVCDPVHATHVPYPYQAPLRAYFPVTPLPIGFNGPLDCSTNRSRIVGWDAVTTVVTARPPTQMATSAQAAPMRVAAYNTSERTGLSVQMKSLLAPAASPEIPGGGFHYAASKSAPLFPAVPAGPAKVAPAVVPVGSVQPVANRPFTNP